MGVAIEAKQFYRTERILTEELTTFQNLEKFTFINERIKDAKISFNGNTSKIFPQLKNVLQKVIYPCNLDEPEIAQSIVTANKTLCLIPNDSIQSYLRYTRRHQADTLIIRKERLAEIIYVLKKNTAVRLHAKILPFILRRYLFREIHNLFGGNLKHIIILGKYEGTKEITKFLNILGITTSLIQTKKSLQETNKNVKTTIYTILKNIFKLEISNNKKLISDLGMDSLTRVEIITAIEDHLGVMIFEKDLNEQSTVENLIHMTENSKFDVKELASEVKLYKKRQLLRFSQILREMLRNTVMILIQNIFITKISISNSNNMDKIQTPSILIFNHVGHLDSSVILRVLPKRLRVKLTALADVRLYFKPMGSFLLRYFGNAYPVDKWGGPVRESLEIASDLIADGWSVLLSPEGKISLSGELQDFKLGSAVLIAQTGVPVVPFKIEGYKKLFPQVDYKIPMRRVPVSIKIGEPFTIPDTTNVLEINKAIRTQLEKL